MTDELSERLHTEATARVTWGEAPEDVAKYLAAQGMDCSEAARLVNQLVAERNQEVRRRSLQKVAVGCGMMLVALIFFTAAPWSELLETHWNQYVFVAGSAGVGGLWLAFRGISGLAVPQAEELSDVDQDLEDE